MKEKQDKRIKKTNKKGQKKERQKDKNIKDRH